MWRHILPNASAPIIVQATVCVSYAILAEAGLSFLGLGVEASTPTWGLILADSRSFISRAWWLGVFPGLFIMITVLSINFLGDALRDLLEIRSGADVAKALALGADAVSIGTAALVAMGDNSPEHDEAYREIGSAAGFYDDWQAGRDPTGISTQDDELATRFDPILGGRRIANYLRVLTLETQTLARACGKSHVHNLEPEDLVALTVEAAAMAKVPLAGTDWIPGANGS